jgi:hypothetical protein
LDLSELDLDPRRGSVLVRRGKGGRRREVGMDDWAFDQLQPWLTACQTMPRRPPVLRHQRTHPRTRLVSDSRARRTTTAVDPQPRRDLALRDPIRDSPSDRTGWFPATGTI